MHIGSALAAVLVHQLANVSQVRPPGEPASDAQPEAMTAMREGELEQAALCDAKPPRPMPTMAELEASARPRPQGERLAVATVITDESDMAGFVQGAVALGASLLEHLTLRVDKLLLVRENLTLPREEARRLRAVGWYLGRIPTIIPPHPPNFKHFAHQFSKLALWNLTRYSRILYMDADTFALGNVDLAFDVVMDKDQYLAAVRDFRYGYLSSEFNMGVAVLRPDKEEYQRLLRLLMEDNVTYRQNWAEQGFLGAVYRRHAELPFEFNGNVACEAQKPEMWNATLPNIRVVHFTLCKPWKCRSKESRYCGQYDQWKHFLQRGELLAEQQAKEKAQRWLKAKERKAQESRHNV